MYIVNVAIYLLGSSFLCHYLVLGLPRKQIYKYCKENNNKLCLHKTVVYNISVMANCKNI